MLMMFEMECLQWVTSEDQRVALEDHVSPDECQLLETATMYLVMSETPKSSQIFLTTLKTPSRIYLLTPQAPPQAILSENRPLSCLPGPQQYKRLKKNDIMEASHVLLHVVQRVFY
jgi:hypothetical protein